MMRTLLFCTILLSIIVSTTSIKCYNCNSLIQKDCAENFVGKFVQNCVPRKFGGSTTAVAAIGCRKTTQYASGESSIIRECAYFGEPEVRTQKGSSGVRRLFIQCTTDLCNSAVSFNVFVIPAMLIAVYNMF